MKNKNSTYLTKPSFFALPSSFTSREIGQSYSSERNRCQKKAVRQKRLSSVAVANCRWIIEQLLHVYDCNIQDRTAKVIMGTAILLLASNGLRTNNRPISKTHLSEPHTRPARSFESVQSIDIDKSKHYRTHLLKRRY